LKKKQSALLLHLLKVLAEISVSTSASGLGCLLVVAFLQVSFLKMGIKPKD
jgi:hypothetical protein